MSDGYFDHGSVDREADEADAAFYADQARADHATDHGRLPALERDPAGIEYIGGLVERVQADIPAAYRVGPEAVGLTRAAMEPTLMDPAEYRRRGEARRAARAARERRHDRIAAAVVVVVIAAMLLAALWFAFAAGPPGSFAGR